MQRYSRDRDRDDGGSRAERGSQARNDDDRFSQGRYRDTRGEFGGGAAEDERGSAGQVSRYGTSQEASRWREPGDERDPLERQDGSGGQGDYYTGGGALYDGRQDENYRGWREHRSRATWQPGRQMGDPRHGQYGETEYGVYRPRYGGTYSGGSPYTRPAGERGDDRFGRQGYGRSEWQQPHEREEHDFDPDYLQWRAEQIRNLDRDYLRYRQELYKKFSDEFGSWRKNQESMKGSSGSGSPPESGAQDLTGTSRDLLGTSKSNK